MSPRRTRSSSVFRSIMRWRKHGARKPKDPEKLRKRLEEEATGKKIWRLSHDAVFGGGPEGLAAHQTAYHKFVAHLGLARGRDTVGLGIKHIPLKRYAELLTKMDRDLRRQAEELANERQMLAHYDQQLRDGFEKQRCNVKSSKKMSWNCLRSRTSSMNANSG